MQAVTCPGAPWGRALGLFTRRNVSLGAKNVSFSACRSVKGFPAALFSFCHNKWLSLTVMGPIRLISLREARH